MLLTDIPLDAFGVSLVKELDDKITVSLLYYGLLQKTEPMTLQVKDISLSTTEEMYVGYPYATKRIAQGFSSKIPTWLKPSFELYLS